MTDIIYANLENQANYINRMSENIETMRKQHRAHVLKLMEIPGVDIPKLVEIFEMTRKVEDE